MLIRTAKVIDNEDPDKLGRVQVQILPEFIGITTTTDLPWARPFISKNGGIKDTGSHNPPEKDSMIRVVITDKFWKEIFVLGEEYIEGFNAYDTFDTWSSKITELGSQTYPNPRFNITADETVKFHNTETGEIGLLHKSGIYCIIDKDGKVFANLKDKDCTIYNNKAEVLIEGTGNIKVTNTNCEFSLEDAGNFKIKNTTCTIEGGSASVKINNNLEVLV